MGDQAPLVGQPIAVQPPADTALERTICPRTGFALVQSSGQTAFRIAKTSYGPMNPPLRGVKEDRREWGRWDVVGHRTIYSGNPEPCAYAESLAWAKPAIDIQLSDLFDPSDEDEKAVEDVTLEEAVAQEWADRHHMRLGCVPAGWRQERLLHQLVLPSGGWFVDIEAAETISAITKQWTDLLVGAEVSELTTAHLHGEKRSLTTGIAEKIHASMLADGSYAHGIIYSSKHDAGWRCWAIWLRALDDGKTILSEPTRTDSGRTIEEPNQNPALKRVSDLFGFRCH